MNISQIASLTSSIRSLRCSTDWCCESVEYIVEDDHNTYYLCRSHASQYHTMVKQMRFDAYEREGK
jgi:hypothetical protein